MILDTFMKELLALSIALALSLPALHAADGYLPVSAFYTHGLWPWSLANRLNEQGKSL